MLPALRSPPRLSLVPGEGTMLDASPVAQLSTRLAPAPYVDRFGRVYGSTLTPQVVTDVLQNADAGLMFSLADLCDEIRGRDGHLSAELQKRELRVAGSEWELVPPEGSGESGEMIAKWCSARLREIDSRGALSFTFGDAVASLQGAVFHGRAGLEIVWRAEDGWYVPEGLYFIHPRRFAFSTDFAIHLWDASGTAVNALQPMSVKDSPFGEYPGIALSRFPRGKFVVHQPRVRGVYPTREGLGVLLVWWCTFKRFGVRDFLAFAEWAGRGLRVGYFATGRGPLGEYQATPEDQQVLQQVLDAMSSSNSAVFADTTKPEIINSPTNNDVHSNLIALCNSEISKAVVGGTLGSEPGARGARSLGEVHERNELMIARADAAAVGSTLVRDLVAPMVALNFGRNAPVPRFRFAVDPAQDLDKMSERIERFVNNGGEIAQSDARNLLNFPDPTPGAPLLRPKGHAPTPPAAPAVPASPIAEVTSPLPQASPLERPVMPPSAEQEIAP